MDVRGRLLFKDAAMLHLEQNRNETKQLKSVATIMAPLSQEVADIMKIRGVFRENGTPEQFDEKRSLGHRLSDIEFYLPDGTGEGNRVFRPGLITGFKVVSKDGELTITFTAHISGDDQTYDLIAIRKRFLGKEDTFECAIRSAQEEFDFTGGGSGTAVDMSSAEGSKAAEEPPPLLAQGGPALVDIRQMGIVREKKQRTRGEMAEPTPEELQAEATVSVE